MIEPNQPPTRVVSLNAADVAVIGGGLVGAPLALALAGAGLDVALVDAAAPATLTGDAFDGRASAIALATQRVLAGIEVWPRVAGDAAPILDIRVADGASPMFLHYDHDDVEGDALGYMVENRHLRRALAARIAETPGVHLFAPASVASTERGADGVEVRLADGREIRAGLLVAADGRNSGVRDAAGIRVTRWTYGQTAIVCTVGHEIGHDNVAHEHFLSAGPFAILPLTGNRSSIVWTERDDLARDILALEPADFLAELVERFGDFLGALEIVGPVWSYPLALQFAERTVDARLALAGDAAHAMHPIAGQGLNMGLRDVAALSEVVADAHRLGLDIGGAQVLAEYQRWRRFDNSLMLAATDALNRLFSNDIAPVRLARDLGLAAVDRLPPLKRMFMRHAMGLAGELPRLMKGEAL